jgi:hypothetical protein
MLAKLWDFLFGCRHSRYSFPLTIRAGSRRAVAGRTGTYVVCLDCGHEFNYDWQGMHIADDKLEGAARPFKGSEAASALLSKQAS